MKRYQAFIDGACCEPASGEWLESFDPFSGKPWALIPRCNAEDVDRAVATARRAFETGPWPALSPSARGALLRRIADGIAARIEEIAETEVRDNGKRLVEVLPQLRYVPQYFHYCAGLADKVEGTVVPIDVPDTFNFTRYEPIGVVAAITPWNSPIMLAAWKLAPALAAGNTVVLKPSEHASASTLEFVRIMADAGLPPGVVNVVTGLGQEAGEPLVTHPDVAKISFTGSDAAGRRIAALAGRDVKRVTLELGGKSPQIVFQDASIPDAVNGVVAGIFVSLGQSCVAGSRLIVHEAVHDRFLEELKSRMADLRMGSPFEKSTELGPIATKPQYDKVLEFIAATKAEGATCVMGGKPASRPECGNGWFIEPTVFTGVAPHMRLWREEVFGPVLAVTRFKDEEDAVRLANDTRFGLAAGIWTECMQRSFRVSQRLQCGTVYVNTYRGVSALSPAGGYKTSGYGRENGLEAIKEYLQVKSVWIGTGRGFNNPFPRA